MEALNLVIRASGPTGLIGLTLNRLGGGAADSAPLLVFLNNFLNGAGS